MAGCPFMGVMTFFSSFFEKSSRKFCQFAKSSYLCTRFREMPGGSPRAVRLARHPAERWKNGSLTDCEQDKKRQGIAPSLLPPLGRGWRGGKHRSHSFNTLNEQWSRKAWRDGQMN